MPWDEGSRGQATWSWAQDWPVRLTTRAGTVTATPWFSAGLVGKSHRLRQSGPRASGAHTAPGQVERLERRIHLWDHLA